MQSRDNTKNARIEGINELMLQAKVPENHDRLEVVPRALNLTKSPRHLTQCATHSNCPQMPPHTLTPYSRTNYRELAALHRDEVLHLDESTNSVHDTPSVMTISSQILTWDPQTTKSIRTMRMTESHYLSIRYTEVSMHQATSRMSPMKVVMHLKGRHGTY
jgi:hypothetical protein